MELPALYKIADVLAGAVQQLASACRIGDAARSITLKIMDGKRNVHTFPVQLIGSYVQILPPGDPITVRLDLHSRKQPGVLQDRRKAAVSTELTHLALSRGSVA